MFYLLLTMMEYKYLHLQKRDHHHRVKLTLFIKLNMYQNEQWALDFCTCLQSFLPCVPAGT